MSPAVARETVHATCLDFDGDGILLLGRPGSGKSDLALRLIDSPGTALGGPTLAATLVADDQTVVEAQGGMLFASPPGSIAGRLEVRGLGIVDVPHVTRTRLGLVVELVTDRGLERLPELPVRHQTYLGIDLPVVRIAPFEASAPAKLRAALAMLVKQHK